MEDALKCACLDFWLIRRERISAFKIYEQIDLDDWWKSHCILYRGYRRGQTLSAGIIFFDEIDGLAPVRSAKNDQVPFDRTALARQRSYQKIPSTLEHLVSRRYDPFWLQISFLTKESNHCMMMILPWLLLPWFHRRYLFEAPAQ